MSKITKATFKSFIAKNRENLHIKVKSSFDGMVDCVTDTGNGWTKAEPTSDNQQYTLGIGGLWLVGQSRDYFEAFDQEGFTGIRYYNCCGSGVLAVPTTLAFAP